MITDNSPHIRTALKSVNYNVEQWELLRNSIAHRSVKQLCDEHSNLLIFPHCLGDRRKEFCDTAICSIIDDTIITGNLMGFVGVNDGKISAELSIRSRFYEEGKQDYFLHYMLQKVFHFNLFNLPTSSGDSESFEFILFHLFTHYLKKAIKQGVFKQYQKCEYNDANVKGAIDVARHLRYNIPFNGKIAYRTSEYRYDNPVTQLIRHTIEYIRRSPVAGNVFKCDKNTDDAVRKIYDVTLSYNANDRQRIINQNLKPVKHPFYTQYTFLQRLCLHILRHKKMSYSSSDNKVYGILFDGAWLWEEYLATILCEKGFTHAVKGEGTGFQLYKGGSQRFPDFYDLRNGGVVLDAKYKRLNKGIQRNDLYQLITYIHTLNDGENGMVKGAEYGAFVYPNDGKDAQNNNVIWKKIFGMGRYIGIIPIEIPNKCEEFDEFVARIEQAEKNLSKMNCEEYMPNKYETFGEMSLCEE